MKKRKKVGIEWGKNTGRKGGREEKLVFRAGGWIRVFTENNSKTIKNLKFNFL